MYKNKYKNLIYYRVLFSLKVVGTVFVSSLYAFKTSSHIITESSIISFSQLHVAGFQI